MPARHAAIAIAAAVITLTTVVVAQSSGTRDRFTFLPVNGNQAGPSGEGRFEITVNRWATPVERDRLLSAAAEGPDRLRHELATSFEAGYIRWPGYIEYIVRYAQQVPRPDGGQDVVLATDLPIQRWWTSAPSPSSPEDRFTVVQLRLNKDGTGEGKLSRGAGVSVSKELKTIVLEDYANQPITLAEVRLEKGTS